MAASFCTFSKTRDYTTLHGAQWVTKENDNRFNERFLFLHTLFGCTHMRAYVYMCQRFSVTTRFLCVHCKKKSKGCNLAVSEKALSTVQLATMRCLRTTQRLSSAHERKVIKKLSQNITVKAKINGHLYETMGISSCCAKVLILTRWE